MPKIAVIEHRGAVNTSNIVKALRGIPDMKVSESKNGLADFYREILSPNRAKRKHASRSCYSPHYGKNAARRNRVQADLEQQKREGRHKTVAVEYGCASDEMYALTP